MTDTGPTWETLAPATVLEPHGKALVEHGHVQCPAHGLRFRLTDGLLANSPPGSHATSLGVRTFPIRLHEGELQIQVQAAV